MALCAVGWVIGWMDGLEEEEEDWWGDARMHAAREEESGLSVCGARWVWSGGVTCVYVWCVGAHPYSEEQEHSRARAAAARFPSAGVSSLSPTAREPEWTYHHTGRARGMGGRTDHRDTETDVQLL